LTERRGWIVAPEDARIRLDQYLVRLVSSESRSQVQQWIRKGFARVNGSQAKTGYLIRPGDEITVELPAESQFSLAPEPIPLELLYEDDDIAVIAKPAGLACHAGAGVRSGTLVNALLARLGPLRAGEPSRPGIVHRLDKLTSGVMVVAKNNQAHRCLTQQFRERTVLKEYLALVYGCPDQPQSAIDSPLGRDLRDRKKISVRARRGRSAVTHYRVEKKVGPFSLLRIRIETGRTHQIRVHLASKGHPVVGDTLYGGRRSRSLADAGLRSAVDSLGRVFLHSCRLEFRHPMSGQRMTFSCPLPTQLMEFLGAVGTTREGRI